jgi:hypothetical protein
MSARVQLGVRTCSRKDHTASWRLGNFQKVVGEEKRRRVSLWTSYAGYIYVERIPLDSI